MSAKCYHRAAYAWQQRSAATACAARRRGVASSAATGRVLHRPSNPSPPVTSGAMRDLFCCYLLRSLSQDTRGRTYIGFTVDPRRRLRQHNGELVNGACRTRSGRPWQMVLVVYGFPTQVQALQFEWAWQHPAKSRAARAAHAALKSRERTGVAGKVRLLLGMLCTPPWCYYPLTLQVLEEEHARLMAGAVLPVHMPLLLAPMDALPAVSCAHSADSEVQEEEEDKGCSDASGADSSAKQQGQALSDQLPEKASQQQMQQCGSTHSRGAEDSGDDGRDDGAGQGRSTAQQPVGRQRVRAGLRGRAGAAHTCSRDSSSSGSSSSIEGGESERTLELLSSSSSDGGRIAGVDNDQCNSSPGIGATAGESERDAGADVATAAVRRSRAAAVRCACCGCGIDRWLLSCSSCGAAYHTPCLAAALQQQEQELHGSKAMNTLQQLQQGGGGSSLQLAELQARHQLLLPPPGAPLLQLPALPPPGEQHPCPSGGACVSCGRPVSWYQLLRHMAPFGPGTAEARAREGGAARKPRTRAAKTARGGSAAGVVATATKGGGEGGGGKGRGGRPGGRRGRSAAGVVAACCSGENNDADAGAGDVLNATSDGAVAGSLQRGRNTTTTTSRRPGRQRAAGPGLHASSSVAAGGGGGANASGTAPQQLPALAELTRHLTTSYPHLQLPEDPSDLASLLLLASQHHAVSGDSLTQQLPGAVGPSYVAAAAAAGAGGGEASPNSDVQLGVAPSPTSPAPLLRRLRLGSSPAKRGRVCEAQQQQHQAGAGGADGSCSGDNPTSTGGGSRRARPNGTTPATLFRTIPRTSADDEVVCLSD